MWCVASLAAAVAALSTTLSTAALDKHPQSKERGITLDLGFSSFKVGALGFPLLASGGGASPGWGPFTPFSSLGEWEGGAQQGSRASTPRLHRPPPIVCTQMPLPPHLAHLPYDELQITLVDCPGHASLIRTIIGGAQIIDLMVLVVDVTKGEEGEGAQCPPRLALMHGEQWLLTSKAHANAKGA